MAPSRSSLVRPLPCWRRLTALWANVSFIDVGSGFTAYIIFFSFLLSGRLALRFSMLIVACVSCLLLILIPCWSSLLIHSLGPLFLALALMGCYYFLGPEWNKNNQATNLPKAWSQVPKNDVQNEKSQDMINPTCRTLINSHNGLCSD